MIRSRSPNDSFCILPTIEFLLLSQQLPDVFEEQFVIPPNVLIGVETASPNPLCDIVVHVLAYGNSGQA
ncbi:MAG: hypothetical protein P8J37_24000 [Fuerstiella sp.]|nr:hypothetical protein [Fuerstiella sp.]